MNPQINFDPLNQMEDIQLAGKDINFADIPGTLKKLSAADYIVVCLFMVLAIAAALLTKGWGLLLILTIPAFIVSKRLNNQRAGAWRSFAAANGWQVLPASVGRSMLPPSLGAVGHSYKESEVIAGTTSDFSFNIFEHDYTVGYGKSAQYFGDMIMAIKLNVSLEPLFLKSIKSGVAGNNKNLEEKLQLEGDFNKYFHIYAVPGQEVDDLTILTPDVMQFLMASDSSYNIEILGDTMFIISGQGLVMFRRIESFFEFSTKLYKQIMENLPLAKTPAATAPAANASSY